MFRTKYKDLFFKLENKIYLKKETLASSAKMRLFVLVEFFGNEIIPWVI